jgi:hypothetical protein
MTVKLLDFTQEFDRVKLQHGFFDDFDCPPPRQHANYTAAALTNAADLASTIIFAAGPNQGIQLESVLITPDGASAQIDNTNTSVWTVTDGTNTIVAETFNAADTFPATQTQQSLGTLAFRSLAAGGRLELAIANGTAVDTPLTVVTVEYSPLEWDGWKFIATDGGAFSFADAVGGRISITPSDGTESDNDECYLVRKLETFLIAANKPIVAKARVQFSEANTDDANVMFGLMNAWAANHLQDGGAGPAASYSGAVIYKVDGGTVWKTQVSLSTTQDSATSTKTAGGSAFQELEIRITPVNATEAIATFFVDGAQLLESTSRGLMPIEHRFTFTNATEMQLGFGVKNGGANAETLVIDAVACQQTR